MSAEERIAKLEALVVSQNEAQDALLQRVREVCVRCVVLSGHTYARWCDIKPWGPQAISRPFSIFVLPLHPSPHQLTPSKKNVWWTLFWMIPT